MTATLGIQFTRLHHWLLIVGSVMLVSFPLGLLRSQPGSGDKPSPNLGNTNWGKPLQSAKNPELITLFPEGNKVVGWIAGKDSHQGKKVQILFEGKAEEVVVDAENAFSWEFHFEKPVRVKFWFCKLQESITLVSRPALQATAFFILDRSVYRPKQKLEFTALIRELNPQGEFVPVTKKKVEIKIVSQAKKLEIAKLPFTTDAEGRIEGSYSFLESDPLDNYTLTIPDMTGSGEFQLAEYRKETSRLELVGAREGGKLQLRFKALDYLDRPQPAEKIDWTIQVRSLPQKPSNSPLEGKDFAYANVEGNAVAEFDAVDEDDKLMKAVYDITPIDLTRQVFWEDRQQQKLSGKSRGELSVEIPELFRHPRYSAIVRAVLVDANGRELRRAKIFPLGLSSPELQLTIPRPSFVVGEPIRVRAAVADAKTWPGPIALTVLKLTEARRAQPVESGRRCGLPSRPRRAASGGG